jgi:hypothetical protein
LFEAISKIVDHLLGWPVERVVPLSQLSPLKKEKCLIIFFTGKRANGQRAQPVEFEYFESV